METLKIIETLLQENNGYIKTSELKQFDITRQSFYSLIKTFNLVRVSKGLYRDKDLWDDELFVLNQRYSEAVFSHETAAYLLNLSDREPIQYSLTFKAGKGSARINKAGIKVYKVKDELYEIGLTEMTSPFGNKIQSYNPERTICDLVRSRKNIEIQEYQSILRTYLISKDRNLPELMHYAKLFSIDRVLKQTLEILL